MNLKNSRCQRWSALQWVCSLFWTLATRTYMEGTMGQRSRWRHQNCYCCKKITIITNNLSQLNLQIFSPENIWEVFSCQCFHRVSLVGQPGGYCLIFFPFLRKCQRRKKHTLQMWRPLEVQAFHSGPAKNRYNRPEQSRKQKLGRTTNLTSIPPPTLNIAKVGNLRQKFKLFLHHPLLPLDDFFLR